jgi:hypothetical protein
MTMNEAAGAATSPKGASAGTRVAQERKALAFEQQPKESNKAFAAFSLYLNMGPQRSLTKVGQKLHKSVTMLGRWSVKFDWPSRIQAHGAHLATVEREAVEVVARGKAVEWGTRQQSARGGVVLA